MKYNARDNRPTAYTDDKCFVDILPGCVQLSQRRSMPEGFEPSRRCKVKIFSRKSRKRLAFKLFGLVQAPQHFLTLTYPRYYPADAKEWKIHLDRFCKALARRFPQAWFVWKLEPQKRGAPHYHLLGSFGPNPPCMRMIRKWLAVTWAICVGTTGKLFDSHVKAGTNAEFINYNSKKLVSAYVAKYIGKEQGLYNPETGEVFEEWSFPGRFWGVLCRKNMPSCECTTVCCTYNEYKQIRRLCRRWIKQYSRKMYNCIGLNPQFWLIVERDVLWKIVSFVIKDPQYLHKVDNVPIVDHRPEILHGHEHTIRPRPDVVFNTKEHYPDRDTLLRYEWRREQRMNKLPLKWQWWNIGMPSYRVLQENLNLLGENHGSLLQG